MHEVWMHYRTLMLRKLCEKLIKFKKKKAMIVLIVDMDWMGLQSFPNKALLNNDSIWVKHTGKKTDLTYKSLHFIEVSWKGF